MKAHITNPGPTQIRVKLPDGWAPVASGETREIDIDVPPRPPLTLVDMNEMARRFMAAATAQSLMRENALADMLAMGYTPPTRRERFKRRLLDLRQRAKDIWTILRGGDVHENCGY